MISHHPVDIAKPLVEHFEGCYLAAYRDPVGVWTIGYGHTGLIHKDGTVHDGRKISKAKAVELLDYDLSGFWRDIQKLTLPILNQHQKAALISFAFNLGMGNLRRSTLLKKLQKNDYLGAANEFHKWNRAGGRVLDGLTRRRISEARLFCQFPNPIISTTEFRKLTRK